MNRSIMPKPSASVVAALGLSLGLALPMSALADPVTYSYVGNAFTRVDSPTLGSHITASVTFASGFNPLGEVKDATQILSWSISTETVLLTSATGGTLIDGAVFNFQNGVGIREWYLAGRGNGTALTTGRSSTSSFDSAVDLLYVNLVQYQPGTWTIAAAQVPEPTSLLLMATGIAGLLLYRRRGR